MHYARTHHYIFGKGYEDEDTTPNSLGWEIIKQLGANKFIAMTGAKGFSFGSNGLSFKIGRNAKAVNYVVIDLNAKDLYDIKFQKGSRVLKQVNDVRLAKKVELSERPFILGYFLLVVPIYFLIYVSKVRTI